MFSLVCPFLKFDSNFDFIWEATVITIRDLITRRYQTTEDKLLSHCIGSILPVKIATEGCMGTGTNALTFFRRREGARGIAKPWMTCYNLLII